MSDLVRSDALIRLVDQVDSRVVRVESSGRTHRASGIRWSNDGFIVTTASAVGRQGEVIVGDETWAETRAAVVGRDPATDIALLRIDNPQGDAGKPLQVDSDPARVGQVSIAVARPGRGVRALFGVIGATGGEFHTPAGGRIDAWIELDRSIPRNLSGGGVFGLEGRLIGIVSFAMIRGGAVIPTRTVDRVVEQLSRHGDIPQGYIGVAVHPARISAPTEGSPPSPAVVVLAVEPNGPAEQAGILVGDVLLQIDGVSIDTPMALKSALTDKTSCRVGLNLLRGGQSLHLELAPSIRK